MDKTLNDLVSIVHRTKKINGQEETVEKKPEKKSGGFEVRELDIVEEKENKKVGLKGVSVISDFLNKKKEAEKKAKRAVRAEKLESLVSKAASKSSEEKETKEKAVKKTTAKTVSTKTTTAKETKKTTVSKTATKTTKAKTTTKPTTAKKTTAKTKTAVKKEDSKKDIEDLKVKSDEVKKASVKKKTTEEKETTVASTLKDLREKKTADAQNYAYEKYWQEVENGKDEEPLFEVEKITPTTDPLAYPNEEKIKQWSEHSEEIDRKIAEYYKRKSEKITEEERIANYEDYIVETKPSEYEEQKSEYQELFEAPSEVVSRSSLIEEKEEVETVEESKDKYDLSADDEGHDFIASTISDYMEVDPDKFVTDTVEYLETVDTDLDKFFEEENVEGDTEYIIEEVKADEDNFKNYIVEDFEENAEDDIEDYIIMSEDEDVDDPELKQELYEKMLKFQGIINDLKISGIIENEEEKEEGIVETPEVEKEEITVDKDVEPIVIDEAKVKENDSFYMSELQKEENDIKATNIDEKELGDINLNKDINNAVPSSKILETLREENKVSQEEMDAIYKIFTYKEEIKEKENKEIKVLYVASECQPFVASGGLGDVAGSLPKAIVQNGNVDLRVILPLYGTIKDEYRKNFEYLGNFTVHLSWRQEYCGLFRYHLDGVTYYFIDNERYFKRDNLYGYFDDGERFAYFCKAIVEALPHLNFFPDIIHCNDWQTALVSAYIKTGKWSDDRYYNIRNIYTIHNVEYQGVFGMENLRDLFGIDSEYARDLDYSGNINLTKAAIQFSDKFTTVSESYCDNLKQPYCSRGLHHIIIRNEYKLSGIINGLDLDFYNPQTDTIIYQNYSVDKIEDKIINKKKWQDELGLPVDAETPMIAIVSRLVSLKGIDLFNKIAEDILSQDVQLVIVGTGDEKYTGHFKYLESKYPTKVRALVDKYSNEYARKTYAASDIFVMPSKIEPCGISQMVASRYGSVPIVREVGGLKDSIKDFGCEGGGNGYTFTNYNQNDLLYQINRAIKDYKDADGWREKVKTVMTQDFSWDKSAEKYIDLYKSVL